MIKTSKEDFIANAADYLDRCVDREERVRIDCEGKRCVLVDEGTWVAMVNVLREVVQVEQEKTVK